MKYYNIIIILYYINTRTATDCYPSITAERSKWSLAEINYILSEYLLMTLLLYYYSYSPTITLTKQSII